MEGKPEVDKVMPGVGITEDDAVRRDGGLELGHARRLAVSRVSWGRRTVGVFGMVPVIAVIALVRANDIW